MTKQELLNKYDALKKELQMLVLYEKAIKSEIGKRNYEEAINNRLEEIRQILSILKKWKK